MLYVCVRGVMDVVFSVCIVTHGAVCARVWLVMSVSCLPHGVVVSVFITCRGLCACTEML